MSRSFKSKNAQRAHRSSYFYSKAFGFKTDHNWIDEGDHFRFGICEITDKREIYRESIYVKFKTANHQKRTGTDGNDRKLNKKHRKEVKALIFKFMKGQSEDVVTTAVGPRSPCWYW